MRLAHVKIRDILGIDELEFDAGAFTLIEGRNGSGKTSVLEAIKCVTKGGTDATLLRNGANDGEAILVFDDGSSIRKRVTDKTQSISFRDADGKAQGSPMTAIAQLVDAFSVNPVAFLQAPAKQRVSVLLESLPTQADPARIREIVGDPDMPVTGENALRQIDNAYTVIFDERTGTQRAAREKEATITQLAGALPPAGAGATGDPVALRARLNEIDDDERAEMKRIEDRLASLRTEHESKVTEMREEIAAIQSRLSTAAQEFADWQGKAAQRRADAAGEFAEQRAPVRAQLVALDADQESAIRAKATRETIGKMEAQAESLRQDAQRQTAALEALTAYKAELLSSLPIDGLEVRDGEIFRHGVAFDRLNKAQQVEIAVEIAKLRAGDLKVICVDDLEMLDSEHFEAFREQALASGLQLIVTRVSDGDFAVRAAG